MAQEKKDISAPQKGMNRDKHPSQLQKGEYPYMLNGNVEDQNGAGFPILQNEHSNLLCSGFKSGYKVVGKPLVDIANDRVFYFLLDPETDCSEIGYIRNINNVTNEDDLDKECGCDVSVKLAEPLEGQVQDPTCTYTTLISDCEGCPVGTTGNFCLNFNLNYPISSEIKQDRSLGTVITFTDDINNMRRLEADNIEQYYEDETECDESDIYSQSDVECDCGKLTYKTCINCEKMLVQQPFKVPCMVVASLVNGGGARHGVYEFYIAYTDGNGNEITRFMSPTGEVSVKDLNKTIYQQPELDAPTNYSIKLSIESIDTDFDFFKIVVKQITSVDLTPSYFELGIYPTTTKEVIYSGATQNLERTNPQKITADFPYYLNAKTVESANNVLFFTDLEAQPEINLQPVVNLMGQFARWRTVIAEEELYAAGANTANYRSYLRDEVRPYSIRFFTDYGYVTANFPLIARAKIDTTAFSDVRFNTGQTYEWQVEEINDMLADYDDKTLTSVSSDWRKDVFNTLVKGAGTCTSEERNEKWQFYNTATVEKTELYAEYDCGEVDDESDIIPVERNCVFYPDIPIDVSDINPGGYEFTEFFDGESWTGIEDYINNHQQWLCDNYPELCLEDYAQEDESVVDVFGEELDCCTPNFPDTCSDELFYVDSFVRLSGVEETNASDEIGYKSCSTGYSPSPPPISCNAYKREGGGDFVNINPCFDRGIDKDDDEDKCRKCKNSWCYPYSCYVGYSGKRKNKNYIFERENSVYGATTCNGAQDILYDTTQQLPAHLNPVFDEDNGGSVEGSINANNTPATWDGANCNVSGTNLAERIKSSRCDSGITTTPTWSAKILENALWFKHVVDVDETPFLIIDVSKMTGKPQGKKNQDCLVYTKFLRVSVFVDSAGTGNACNATLRETHCVDVDVGEIICINQSEFASYGIETGSVVYLAVDSPLITVTGNTHLYDDVDEGEITSSITTTGGACSTVEYTAPTWGCFSVNIHKPEILKVDYTAEELILNLRKVCTYVSQCEVRIINDLKCDPVPWAEGKFSYWESIVNYPNNEHLYNSKNLIIDSSFFDDLDVEVKQEFEDTFVLSTVSDRYVLNSNADFRCKPIRHFKFPDCHIAPLTDGGLNQGTNPPFKTTKIYPIGFYLDNDIINRFLDLAVLNGLVDSDFRNSISGYEIFVGDVRLDRSVIGKGLLYDMYKYFERDADSSDENKAVWFSNFPYNDLRENNLLYDSNDRDNFVQHPFAPNSDRNVKFTFHSPEFHFDKPAIPFELKVESYYLGNSRGKFTEVERHPEMVLLGDSAYRWATALGTIEATLELLTDITDRLLGAAQSSFAGLVVNWGQAVAWVGFALFVAQRVIRYTFVDLHQKRYEWLKAFYDNGTPYNFAAYYASEGYYNSFLAPEYDLDQGNLLRGISLGQYLGTGRYSFREKFEGVNINQFNRESSVFLSTGNTDDEGLHALAHSSTVAGYDDSRYDSSDANVCNEQQNALFDTNTSREIVRSIYSPYVSLKNYVPAQYGEIDSVRWLPTHYCGKLDQTNYCDTVFGGETFLSRFYLKRKFPFFLNPMLIGKDALPDLTPFSYSQQRNVGFPNYYVDFNTDQSKNFGRFEMPDIKSYFTLDCKYEPKMYVKPPSKFYLYYYGIPSFVVESRINLNYRYGQDNKARDFAPNQSDYVGWTQERNVPISEDNYYFYNPVYSHDNDLYGSRILPFNYDPVEWNNRFDHWDRTIYSLTDGAVRPSNDFVDRWTMFLARNKYDFGNKFGRLFMLKNIESEKVLGLFKDGAVVFNAYNKIEGSAKDVIQGDGGIFATAPTEFFKTELGYGGTQHRQYVSSEFGHFWSDAKRGRIHALAPNGESQDEISRYGLRNWFKENLPFTYAKQQFPDVTDDFLDNPYNGFGILMWWDDRYSRLFVTKKDYRLKDDDNCCIEFREDQGFVQNTTKCDGAAQIPVCPDGYVYDSNTNQCVGTFIDPAFGAQIDPTFEDAVEPIVVSDSECFEECSWTAAYNPVLQSWISYYSFYPNYFVEFNNFFQTGINYGDNIGVYSHLLTNRSFQVFYGLRYDWKIEVPLYNTGTKKWYEDIEFKLDARRYSNSFDYAYREFTFNKAVIWTNRESSGLLNLVPAQKNNQRQYIDFPKYNADSVDILIHNEGDRWSMNTFWDLVRDNHEQTIWNWNCSQSEKELNRKAFSYVNKYHNHLRGEWGVITFINDEETRVKLIFEYLIESAKEYE